MSEHADNGRHREDVGPPPHDLDAEVSAIGSMMLDAEAAGRVVGILRPADFFNAGHGEVFVAAARLWRDTAAAPDVVLLREELERTGLLAAAGGTDFLARLMSSVPTAANAEHYARIVRRLAHERDALAAQRRANAATSPEAASRAVEEWKVAEALALGHRRPRFPLVDVGAFLESPVPPLAPLVSTAFGGMVLFRGGVTVLVGPHKVGKSLAALALAVDVALNAAGVYGPSGSWLGADVSGAGVVHFYSAEGGEVMLQTRLRAVATRYAEHLGALRVRAARPLPRLDVDADLDAVFAAAEDDGAVLLVFDPLGRFWSPEDEADPQLARNLIEGIQTRAAAAHGGRGVAVLITHHDTKAAAEGGAVTGGRGSGKIGDDADALINLRRGDASGTAEARFLLRHGPTPAPVNLELDTETLRWCAMGEPAIRTRRGEDVERFLDAVGRAVVAEQDQLASDLGCSTRTLARIWAAYAAEVAKGTRPDHVRRDVGGGASRTSFRLTDAGARHFGIDGAGAQP